MLLAVAQATTWVGEQLIAWIARLQTQQALTLQESQQR
jgi:hypothetical protein